jgi:hypothetical protein
MDLANFNGVALRDDGIRFVLIRTAGIVVVASISYYIKNGDRYSYDHFS